MVSRADINFKCNKVMKIRYFELIILILLIKIPCYSQNGTAINSDGANPDYSAMLDVSSTQSGLLIPRMIELQRTTIALPAKGLLVYQTDGVEGFYYYEGLVWTRLASGQFIETDPAVKGNNGIIKSNGATLSAATPGSDYLTPTGSASGLTNFPTLNQNTTGTASNVTGVVAPAHGGTGQTGTTAAFNALSPMTTAGDIIYGEFAGSGTRLTKGTSGQVLTMNAGATAPGWSASASGTVTSVSGTTPITVSSGTTTPQVSVSGATNSADGSMSAADKTKLNGIEANANNYVHPSGDGNLHVPATGITNNGKVLSAGSTSGSINWTSLPSFPVLSIAGKTGTVTLVNGDIGLSNVDNAALSAWAGTSNITTLGIIATGTWHGNPIAENYLVNLGASKIASGTLDNSRVNWAAPGNIGSTLRGSGVFTSVNTSNGLSVSSGTVNLSPSGDGGNTGEVLTSDGTGNTGWSPKISETMGTRFIICVKDADFPDPFTNATSNFIGMIVPFTGLEDEIPKNFRNCTGQVLNIVDYQPLFSLIGNTYGGNGYSTFALPDFYNKVPVNRWITH